MDPDTPDASTGPLYYLRVQYFRGYARDVSEDELWAYREAIEQYVCRYEEDGMPCWSNSNDDGPRGVITFWGYSLKKEEDVLMHARQLMHKMRIQISKQTGVDRRVCNVWWCFAKYLVLDDSVESENEQEQ